MSRPSPLVGRMSVGVRSDRTELSATQIALGLGFAQEWPLICIMRLIDDNSNNRKVSDTCCDLRVNEYTAFCNGPTDVKSPRVIVTPPSSRFCPWSAPRPPHYAVRRNGEPI